MFIEAAAQSSIGFADENSIQIGFITMAKEVRLLEEIEGKEYLFKIKKEVEMNEYKQYSFEAITTNTKILTVSGNFTLLIKN